MTKAHTARMYTPVDCASALRHDHTVLLPCDMTTLCFSRISIVSALLHAHGFVRFALSCNATSQPGIDTVKVTNITVKCLRHRVLSLVVVESQMSAR